MDLLRGVVRNYDWGHSRAIAELLGYPPPGHPEAEYWLGAHPSAPSRLLGESVALDKFVAEDPISTVGPLVAERFAGFPFLLKVLAAERPLSIQAHPSLEQARLGFAREEAAQVPVSASNRSYRDDNHKPELICALTEFEAKCGFRPVAESRRLFRLLSTDSPLSEILSPVTERLVDDDNPETVLADLVSWLLRLPGDQAQRLAEATVTAAANSTTDELLSEFGPEIDWTARIGAEYPGDIGVVVALLLNHVSLQPGQAIFLEAGNLHSYLSGVGVELMANSDNVLRGGLTSKHIDVDELLSVVDYRPGAAPVQEPTSPIHRFGSPVPEFGLTRIDSTADTLGEVPFEPIGPEIVLVTSGELALETGDRTLTLAAGSACFVSHADGSYRIIDRAPGRTVAWRATAGSELEP